MVENHNKINNINIANNPNNKKIKYCDKCGKELINDMFGEFCDWECTKEYWQEIRQELDACYAEWSGRS